MSFRQKIDKLSSLGCLANTWGVSIEVRVSAEAEKESSPPLVNPFNLQILPTDPWQARKALLLPFSFIHKTTSESGVYYSKMHEVL